MLVKRKRSCPLIGQPEIIIISRTAPGLDWACVCVGTCTQWMFYVLEHWIMWLVRFFPLYVHGFANVFKCCSLVSSGFIVIPDPGQLSQWDSSIAQRSCSSQISGRFFPSVLSLVLSFWSHERRNTCQCSGHGLSFSFPQSIYFIWFSLSIASHCIIFLLCISILPEVWEIMESRVEKQSSLNPRSLLIQFYFHPLSYGINLTPVVKLCTDFILGFF